MAADRSELSVAIIAQDKASKVFKKVLKQAEKFAKRIRKAMGEGLQMAGKLAAAGLALATAAVVKFGATFEQEMSRVRAITNASETDFYRLNEAVKEAGRTSVFSATEAASAAKFLGMAGFNTNQIIEGLAGTLDLAAAGALELGDAADIASNVISQFNLEASEMNRVSDVLAKTATSANTNVMEMGEALKFAGPVAGALGVSLEETSAVLATLANSGIKAEMAGTAVRNILVSMQDEAVKSKGAFKDLGLAQAVAADGSVDFVKMIDLMSKSSNVARDAVELFGKRAGPALVALVSQGSEAVAEFTKKLEESGGAAKKAAEIQLDNVAGQWKKFMSQVEFLAISIWERSIGPAIKAVLQTINVGFEDLNKSADLGDVIQNVATGILTAGEHLALFFDALKEQIKPVAEAIGDFVFDVVQDFTDPLGQIEREWQKYRQEVSQTPEDVKGVIATMDDLREATRRANEEIAKREAGGESLNIKVSEEGRQRAVQKHLEEILRTRKQNNATMEDAIKLSEQQGESTGKLTATIRKMKKAILDAAAKNKRLAAQQLKAHEDAADAQDKANKEREKSNKTTLDDILQRDREAAKKAVEIAEKMNRERERIQAEHTANLEERRKKYLDNLEKMEVSNLLELRQAWGQSADAREAIDKALTEKLKRSQNDLADHNLAELERMLNDAQETEERRLQIHEEINRRLAGSDAEYFAFFREGFTTAVENFKTANQLMLDLGQKTAEGIRQALSDSLVKAFQGSARSIKEVWADLMKSMLSTLQRTVADMAANQLMQAAVGTAQQRQAAISAAPGTIAGVGALAIGGALAQRGVAQGSATTAGAGGALAGAGVGFQMGGPTGAAVGAAAGALAGVITAKLNEEKARAERAAKRLVSVLYDNVAELTQVIEARLERADKAAQAAQEGLDAANTSLLMLRENLAVFDDIQAGFEATAEELEKQFDRAISEGFKDGIQELNTTAAESMESINDRMAFIGKSIDGELSPEKMQRIQDGLRAVTSDWIAGVNAVKARINELTAAIQGFEAASAENTAQLTDDIRTLELGGMSLAEQFNRFNSEAKSAERSLENLLALPPETIGEQETADFETQFDKARKGILDTFESGVALFERAAELQEIIAAPEENAAILEESRAELGQIQTVLARNGIDFDAGVEGLRQDTITRLEALNQANKSFYDNAIDAYQTMIENQVKQLEAFQNVRGSINEVADIMRASIMADIGSDEARKAEFERQLSKAEEQRKLAEEQGALIQGFTDAIEAVAETGELSAQNMDIIRLNLEQGLQAIADTTSEAGLRSLAETDTKFGELAGLLMDFGILEGRSVSELSSDQILQLVEALRGQTGAFAKGFEQLEFTTGKLVEIPVLPGAGQGAQGGLDAFRAATETGISGGMDIFRAPVETGVSGGFAVSSEGITTLGPKSGGVTITVNSNINGDIATRMNSEETAEVVTEAAQQNIGQMITEIKKALGIF